MNNQNEIEELLSWFGDGKGFGDPDAKQLG